MNIKHYFTKYPNEVDLPFWERTMGRLLGDGLLWLGKRQAKRKDWHEYNHTVMALLAGNSTDCKGTCAVPLTGPLSVERARNLKLTDTPGS